MKGFWYGRKSNVGTLSAVLGAMWAQPSQKIRLKRSVDVAVETSTKGQRCKDWAGLSLGQPDTLLTTPVLWQSARLGSIEHLGAS
jgi:hypothetical protein